MGFNSGFKGLSDWSLQLIITALSVIHEVTVKQCEMINKLLWPAIFMEAIPLCLLLSKLHLFSPTQYGFVLMHIVPSHVCYVFRPVSRPSAGVSIHRF